MMLTRRDALGALLVGGGLGVCLSQVPSLDDRPSADEDSSSAGESELTDDDVRLLVAVAEVVYPSDVTATGEFVESYIGGLSDDRSSIVARTVRSLDAYARRQHGGSLPSLSQAERDSALRSMGVDRTGSNPDGALSERVRYYVVNQLLYGLYTSPTGSRLVGVDNPVGYAGGYESYQQPPSKSASVRR